jgi:predicted nucleotidyltransferase
MTPTYTPRALSPKQLAALSQELKQALTDLYGERLDRLVLYGSYARGDYHAESDVDFLVVLRDEQVKSGREVNFMIDSVYDLSDKYDVLVSVKPTSLIKFLQSDLFLYQAIHEEGLTI